MGTAVMDLNLSQELSRIYHNPLSLVFLELRKAYDTLFRERHIQTFEGYGAGLCLCRLLETLWDHQKVVPRQHVYHILALLSARVTTQDGVISPTLFNVVVDNFIRTWLVMTV